jgi:hypothetical protein
MSTHFGIEFHRGCSTETESIQEIGTYHHTRSSLSSLAVYCDNVLRILVKPKCYGSAEGPKILERRWIVIKMRKTLNASTEMFCVVMSALLDTKIVDHVCFLMSRIEKIHNIFEIVSNKPAFEVGGGKAHGHNI